MTALLQQLAEQLWVLSGHPIKFLTFPYEIRSTIVDLGESLFVHSPVQLAVAKPALEPLGKVGHIVSPNKLHHIFLTDWATAYPEAQLYAPPGLIRKRPDIRFAAELTDKPEPAWSQVVDQRVVRGSLFMDEVVFFHIPSRTLILGDLVENHDPKMLGPAHRFVASANRMLAPNSTTPRNFQWTFLKRAAARRTVREILDWKPERVIVTHGPCIETGAMEFLQRAFAWLL